MRGEIKAGSEAGRMRADWVRKLPKNFVNVRKTIQIQIFCFDKPRSRKPIAYPVECFSVSK